MRINRAAIAAVVAVAGIASACSLLGEGASEIELVATVGTAEANRMLDHLTVADPGSMSDYDRDVHFGPDWVDIDRNGCDQREDVLIRDAETVRPGAHYCDVTVIQLVDPYTGATLNSEKKIQIDHVVSLGAAWRSGAAAWTQEQRLTFANDTTNLLAVAGRVNQQKSDDDPAEWMPPNRAAWCGYAKLYVNTTFRYQLTITRSAKDELAEGLSTCEDAA